MSRDHSDVRDPDTGKVRVLERRCDTCIFRPEMRETFGEDLIEHVVNANVERNTLLTCHSTLPYGANPDFGPAVCAEFMARFGRDTVAGRLARMVGIVRIPPPGEDKT